MSGLVEEIQKDAIDPGTSVSTLLRKVKLAAAKLQLPKIEEWVNHELQGYGATPVPNYRQINGRPKAFNPYNGWIPIMIDPQFMEILSRAHSNQPIAAIEDLLRDDKGATFQSPLSHEIIQMLNKGGDFECGEMANFVGRGSLVAIIDNVRTMVLDWAIALEQSGIKGEGMSFKPEEKIAAQSNPAITIGSVGTLVGVVGNHNSVRDIVTRSIDVSQTRNLAQQLAVNRDALISAGADARALGPTIEGLLAETGKEDPDDGVISGLLSDTRSALAGAAGNLVASGALAVIGTLLGG